MRWLSLPSVLALAVGCGGQAAADEDSWELARAMSSRRSYVAAAQVGDSIYVAGGMVGETGRPLATFQRFDPAANRWTTLPQLPQATRAATAAAVGGVVYLIGGTTAEGNTGAAWAWDGRGWRSRAPLPAARFNHTAVTLEGTIYVLGGFAGGREHDEVFAYDPAADRWSQPTRLPRRTHAFDAVAFRGEIWVIGGRRGEEILREVWILDPQARRWRRGPSMPRPMELLGAAVVGDEIHAVWEHVYQIYDARTGGWRHGPRPVVTRHALQTFHVDGALYTIGGCTTKLRDSAVVERRQLHS